jgi:hypothetical protein
MGVTLAKKKVCASRLDNNPDGPIEAWRRENPDLPSLVVVFSDIDQVAHRHSIPNEEKPGTFFQLVRQFGLLETKTKGQTIDNLDPRIRSQADTLGRLSMIAQAATGQIDDRLPGVGSVWSGDSWSVWHGWAGVELSGPTILESDTITWARPAKATRATGRFHLPPIQRWLIDLEQLTALFKFERAWDDPTQPIGTKGLRLERDTNDRFSPWSGLRLDETGQVWIVGKSNTWRD